MTHLLWPFLVYAAMVFIVIGVMLGLSYVLGQRHREHATNDPYEGGIESYGSARVRYSAQFYVVALLFLVFDLEAAFLYAWAIALRRVGWSGYAGAFIFIITLGIVLIYQWRMGVLDWSRRRLPQKVQGRATGGISPVSAALQPPSPPSLENQSS